VPAGELPALIATVADSINRLSGSIPAEPDKPVPAVPIKKSITRDYLINLEDGKKYKSLKRVLATRHGLTPDEYRTKWGLPSDYPMVAPGYSAARSELAKQMGLGRKPGQKAPAPAKRGRKKASQAGQDQRDHVPVSAPSGQLFPFSHPRAASVGRIAMDRDADQSGC